METPYTLNVVIDSKQLEILKENSYTFCIAWKVNNEYNVVWKSTNDLKLEDHFEWVNKDEYKVFASNTFKVWNYSRS